MDWLSDNLWSVWLTAAAVLGVAELMSLDLVLVMLAVGAVAGAVAAARRGPLVLQLVVAGGAAAGMLLLVRPPVLKRACTTGPELRLGPTRKPGRPARRS